MSKSYMAIPAMVLLFMACEEPENSQISSDQPMRVREIVFQHDEVPHRKLEFQYEGDELSQINYYFKSENGWNQDYISEFSHTPEGYIHEYYYLASEGRKYKHKNIYTFENDRLVQDIYYVGSRGEWFLNSRWDYVFENDKLISYRIYRHTEDGWHERARSFFFYEDDKIREHTYYEQWDGEFILKDRDTFYWENDRLLQYIDYNRIYGVMELNSWSVFTWNEDLTTKIELYARRHDQWRLYKTTHYGYNEEGRLISERTHWGEEMLVFYEKGKGNFGAIFYLPEEIAFNKPRFKSSAEDLSPVFNDLKIHTGMLFPTSSKYTDIPN